MRTPKNSFVANDDIQLSCFWRVNINGYNLSAYEVSGLNEKREIVKYRGGGTYAQNLPLRLGKCYPGQITIKWAVISSNEPGAFIYHLWKDRTTPEKTDMFPPPQRPVAKLGVNITVTLLDRHQTEIMQWNLNGCVPSEYQGPTFTAAKGEIAMQTMIIQFASIESTIPNWEPLQQKKLFKW